MRLLVPAASAALIAVVALSAPAALPTTSAGVTQARPAQDGKTRSGPAPFRSQISVPARARDSIGTTPLPGSGTVAGSTTRRGIRGGFVWPLSPRPDVLRRFEQPLSQWSSGHRGVDLSAAIGQPVLSAGEGVVAFSGVIAGRGVITVRHSGGLRTTYEPVDQRLASATLVHRGSAIGVMSSAPGHCRPLTCLHWGAVAGQLYRDPLSLLSVGRPILLPLG